MERLPFVYIHHLDEQSVVILKGIALPCQSRVGLASQTSWVACALEGAEGTP